MTLKDTYVHLRNAACGNGVIVLDASRHLGFACKHIPPKFKGVTIYVCPAMTYKRRLFTLAHELGHFFELRGEDGRRGLVLCPETQEEGLANRMAVEILLAMRVKKARKEYGEFYRWASKAKVTVRRPSR